MKKKKTNKKTKKKGGAYTRWFSSAPTIKQNPPTPGVPERENILNAIRTPMVEEEIPETRENILNAIRTPMEPITPNVEALTKELMNLPTPAGSSKRYTKSNKKNSNNNLLNGPYVNLGTPNILLEKQLQAAANQLKKEEEKMMINQVERNKNLKNNIDRRRLTCDFSKELCQENADVCTWNPLDQTCKPIKRNKLTSNTPFNPKHAKQLKLLKLSTGKSLKNKN